MATGFGGILKETSETLWKNFKEISEQFQENLNKLYENTGGRTKKSKRRPRHPDG